MKYEARPTFDVAAVKATQGHLVPTGCEINLKTTPVAIRAYVLV